MAVLGLTQIHKEAKLVGFTFRFMVKQRLANSHGRPNHIKEI